MPLERVIYSGVCLCGHTVEQHHCCTVFNEQAAKELGGWVVPDACCYFGSNELEGMDENGEDHCWGYVDAADTNPERIARWKGTKR